MRSRREIYVRRAILLGFAGLIFVWPLGAAAIFLSWMIYVFSAGTYCQAYQGPSLERASEPLGFIPAVSE